MSNAHHCRPAEFTDDALALRFTEEHGINLRHTTAWGRWNVWDGTRWKRDESLYVFDLARGVCRNAASRCESPSRISSAVTVAAVERLARADRHHAATVDQWDADLWLLNTPGGTVDLRTGLERPHRREDYLTKITAASPHGECPMWLRFLNRVTSDDDSLKAYLQRVVGYCLTGITREQALFFLYGKGANGKGVFLNTIANCIGDYSRTAPIEAFIASYTDHHPTDLAGLQGARLVTAVETEVGRCWAESKLKTLTGGDRIAARYMRQDFFEYVPQFKLLIAGNHKPGLRSVDEAITRRFNLIPFVVTIPASERDPGLITKLRAEWGGILQWMIEGCLAWQRKGLNPPDVVRNATAEYFAAEDAISRWIEERCVIDRRLWTSSSALFADWRYWCHKTGEPETSQKWFSQELADRGFGSKRREGARGFQGLGLKSDIPVGTNSPDGSDGS